MRGYQRVIHVTGVAGSVADPLDTATGQTLNQWAKAPFTAVRSSAVIRIYVLAKQCDLTNAGVNQANCFRFNRCDGTGLFRATRIGNDAKRTEFIAAFLNR